MRLGAIAAGVGLVVAVVAAAAAAPAPRPRVLSPARFLYLGWWKQLTNEPVLVRPNGSAEASTMLANWPYDWSTPTGPASALKPGRVLLVVTLRRPPAGVKLGGPRLGLPVNIRQARRFHGDGVPTELRIAGVTQGYRLLVQIVFGSRRPSKSDLYSARLALARLLLPHWSLHPRKG